MPNYGVIFHWTPGMWLVWAYFKDCNGYNTVCLVSTGTIASAVILNLSKFTAEQAS